MRKYFQLSPLDALHLLVIFLSWILLLTGKNGAFPYIGEELLPSTFFWMGSGMCMGVIFYKKAMGVRESLFTFKWKSLPMTVCFLAAFQLYFFHQIPLEKQNQPYFFMWVPLLYWATSIIFYGGRKDLICFRLIPIAALGVFLVLVRDSMVSVVASLLLVAGGLLAFNRRGSEATLFQGAALQTVLAGLFSFIFWQGEGALQMIDIYAAFGGGLVLGLALMLFLKAFSQLSIQISLIGISFALLTDLTLPREGLLVNLFCLPLLFLAVITLRACHYITSELKKE